MPLLRRRAWEGTYPDRPDLPLRVEAIVWSLFFGSAAWMFYIALEPWVRRVWPDLIISWNRLLQGRLRDPMIGRDTLIGGLTGVGATVLYFVGLLLPEWFGRTRAAPLLPELQGLAGIRHQIGAFFYVAQPIVETMVYLFAVLLLRVLLRRRWTAVTVLVLLLAAVNSLGQPNPLLAAPTALLYWAVQILLLVRFGMLAFLASRMFLLPSVMMIPTTDLSTWYAGRTLLFPLALVALAVCAFYTSLAGRPMLADRFLDAETSVEPRAG